MNERMPRLERMVEVRFRLLERRLQKREEMF